MVKAVNLEWSHGRKRPVTRGKLVPSLVKDPRKQAAGRLGAAARMQRRSNGEAAASTVDSSAPAGITTLNPAAVPAWMRGAAEQGLAYRDELQSILVDKDVLFPLAGATVDANTLYRATLALAVKARNPERRAALMSESRAWLKEHRTALGTLSALAGDLRLPAGPVADPLARWRQPGDPVFAPAPTEPTR